MVQQNATAAIDLQINKAGGQDPRYGLPRRIGRHCGDSPQIDLVRKAIRSLDK